MINTFIGKRKQIKLEDDLVIPVEIVEELPNKQYLCQDVAGRWRSPLPYHEDELQAIDDSPSIPHHPLESQIHVNDRFWIKQSDSWLKGTVRSISDTHFRFEWDETYIGGVLKLDVCFPLTWICGIQNGHSPPKLHLAPPKDGILGDENDRRAKLIAERDRLLEEGFPIQGWLETGRVSGTNFRQVFLRSSEPIFSGKYRKYIGKESSPEAIAARKAMLRRQRVKVIERELKKMEKENKY
jgi:hypothetical protein